MAPLAFLVLPLALDTFAVAVALGIVGVPASQRLRVSLVCVGFEAGMPLVGVFVGHALGHLIGSLAEYAAAAALITLGSYMLISDPGDDELAGARMLARTRGAALLGLGLSVSLDELAIGFAIGLLHLPLGAAVGLIALQALIAVQVGMRLGARIGEHLRERFERAAALALIILGVLIAAGRLL